MTPKQLANVLLKVLGLYICLTALPGIIGGAMTAITLSVAGGPGERLINLWGYAIGYVVQGLVGTVLFIKSSALAEIWFKDKSD